RQLLLPRRAYRSAAIGGFGRQISTGASTRDQAFFELPIPARPWARPALPESAGPRTARAFSADPMLRAARRRAVRLPDAIHSPFRRFQANIEFAFPG